MNIKLENEIKSLEGNINRMCVTDDIKELENMESWARCRINRIYHMNLDRLESRNVQQ